MLEASQVFVLIGERSVRQGRCAGGARVSFHLRLNMSYRMLTNRYDILDYIDIFYQYYSHPFYYRGQSKEFQMFTQLKLLPTRAMRVGMLLALSSIVLLAAACGGSVPPTTNPVPVPLANAAATAAPAVVPTSAEIATSVASNAAQACDLLTKDDVSQVLGAPVDTAVSSGLGGVCSYTSKNLKIDFTFAGSSGGKQAMSTTLANLGDLALLVPGLGDQAFYNTNSADALFVLKGDAEYMFGMSDTTFQPLDPAMVQATEKALALQLLSKLP